MLTAPFNFVPLNDRVFFPEWAELVSHDIPFKESCSGEIEVTITAKSPIFVRDHDNPECFCQYDGTYYIPGSSVKGEIRSIFEILTFSKMGLDSFDDNTYAVRDLHNKKLYMSQMNPEDICCGWLKKKEDGYVIEDCGKPGRISHSEIDRMFGIDFSTKFKSGNFKNNDQKMKTAYHKYELLDRKELSGHFRYSHKDVNRSVYVYNPQGSLKGTIVLTGQSSARKEPENAKASGKHYEFIFFSSENIEEIVVEKDLMEKFKFAYFDGRETEPKESKDWGYWKQKLEAGEKVPVFFQKQGSKIKHFGLSYLYKLPYSYSIKDGVPAIHFDKRHDMTEVVFGYVDEQDALKGRVQFSHFKCVSPNGELPLKIVTLGTPRASYYPIYIRQKSRDNYVTYMDDNFEIAGRKRYPVHKGSKPENPKDTGNENVLTKFKPLKEGAVFKGKIRFHNLRPEELGALFSSLTFHGTSGCYHSLGLAKPLGYGKVEMKLRSSFDQESYMKRFEFAIGKQISNWHSSPSITELLTMASEQNNRGNSTLKYTLEDFAKCKNSNDFLKLYSKLDGIEPVHLKSLLNEEEHLSLEELRKEFEQAKKDRKILEEAWHRTKCSDTIDSYNVFIEKYPNSSEAEIARKRIEKITKDREEAKQKERIEEAESKLNKIIKLDSKLKKQALEDFIERYADTPIVERAKKELEAFNSTDKQKSFDIDDLSSALAKCDDLSYGFNIIKKYLSNKGGRPDDIDRKHIRKFYEENVQKLTNKKKRARESKKYKNWIDKAVIDKYI